MPDNNSTANQLRSLIYLALFLAMAALIASIVAIQNSNNNSNKLTGQDTKINELNKEVKLLDRPAVPPAGTGPNTGTQVVPNGSGQ